MRQTLRKLATFGAVGGAASVVHIAVAYGAMRAAGFGVFAANAAGFGAAFLWSYFGHYYLTFRSGKAHGAAFGQFFLVALAGFAINNGVVLLWQRAAGSASIWAVVVAVAIAAGAVFLASNFWAFARRS